MLILLVILSFQVPFNSIGIALLENNRTLFEPDEEKLGKGKSH